MKLEQSFEVAAPLERVWAALIDVEHVAPCLPGAAVTGRNDDGSYNGTFKVKIGPTSAAYSGKLFMENVNEEAHSATMNASGTDKRGQGGAKATIISRVTEGPSGATTVEVVTDYHITGRLARFGRGGMIEEISNRLLGQFATSLQASLAGGGDEPAPAADASAGAPATAVDAEAPATEASSALGAPGTPPTAGPPAVSAPAPGPAPAPAQAPSPPVESEPVEGLSLMGSVLLNQAKRNPAPIAALVIGFLVALRVLRRR
jgi:carbon monoxide dehydrogenase subunit G